MAGLCYVYNSDGNPSSTPRRAQAVVALIVEELNALPIGIGTALLFVDALQQDEAHEKEQQYG